MRFSLFDKQSKEKRFWSWVSTNKTALENFISSEPKDYSIYHQLTAEMKKYNPVLFPEMTLTEKNEVVLIITPDGISEGVLATQKLYDSKPNFPNWKIKKFRQATNDIKLNYDGIEYPSSDIEIIPQINGEREKFDLQIFIRKMDLDVLRHQALAFLYLDHILGEFNTITKIGHIDFYNLENGKTVKNGITLLELRKLIEMELY